MLLPIFNLNFNQKILPGRVTVAKYDGYHPCLTAATAGDKVFIHNPHQRMGTMGGMLAISNVSQEIFFLNINQSVSALAAGHLDPSVERDTLIVGTQTNLLAYDVENNTDLFYKEVADGVNVVTVGKFGAQTKPLVLVGGNCSLQGFDCTGHDPFWTVAGGENVRSLALGDFDDDGENELVVGSDDFTIRMFKGSEAIAEMTETEAVTALTSMQGGRFGYSLANGTVGVYDKMMRCWRIKSKNHAMVIHAFDLDGDGVQELITGWSNGKVDARNERSGEVIFKDNFNHSIAGISEADYRLSAKTELICCSVEGEVRGYQPGSQEIRRGLLEGNLEQETIRELSQKKQNLLLELRNYEENNRLRNVPLDKLAVGPASNPNVEGIGVIPAQTQLQTGLAINMGAGNKPPHVEISLATTNDTILRAVVIFAEGIFEGESHVVHPKESILDRSLQVPIFPPKDVPVDLHIKAMVGYRTSPHFHIFELTRQLPRFSTYAICTEPSQQPEGYVKFQVQERVQRIALWVNQNFLLMNDLEVKDGLDVTFLSIRTNQETTISMDLEGQVTIRTNDMELAGDLVQSLATFLNIEDLQVEVDFPGEFLHLQDLLEKANDYQSVKQKLTAEMADHSGTIRNLIVRSEDSRLLGDMKSMRQWYTQLYEINKDLISGYKISCNNHQDLLNCLKQINQIIQKAGRLRVGKPKTAAMNTCRSAIKNNNIQVLIKTIKNG